ncbi:hypothetical protein SAMN04487910_0648 [Aquimarina amphilecti]|uniref:Uncharacterized protein n=1 Tax=Aquimarina amphilecti TaxID=1038014 RepID=A0A1H7HFZ5_AQUAM|nr:hypothetical protein [Aquimarina amphilecti]SEK49201.1 hypothetical protein SAMN04487910_0648 [Aquimarina amphilecti]
MKKKLLILACLFIIKSISANSRYTKVVTDTTIVTNNTETYKAYDDKEYIHLTIETIDPKVATSILHQGINVYFDVKGKKKKNVFVNYPIAKNQRPPRRNEDRSNEPRRQLDNDGIINQIEHRLRNNIPQKALYTYYEKIKEFNTLLNNENISINLQVNQERNSFRYDLKIPKNKIHPDMDINKLSIGVKTVEILRNNTERTKPTQQASVRGGGGRGGGRSTGGAPQGRSGNGPGGQGRSKGNKIAPSVIAIDFWFKVKL